MNFDETLMKRLKYLEREVDRLKVWEKPDNTGWIPVSATWTYASATTITVPSGAAAIYSVGDKWKLTANSVVLQGYIVGVADTLLTVTGNALTNHTFSAVSYSKAASPLGFPQWFSWTATVTYDGGTTDPTSCGGDFKFAINGRSVTVIGVNQCVTGTGNRTYINWAMPVTPAISLSGAVAGLSNMAGISYAHISYVLSGNVTVKLGTPMTGNFYIWITATYGI